MKEKTIEKILIVVAIFSAISLVTLLYYYKTATNEHAIDVDSDGIPEPYLTGNVTIEVDYMEYCEISQEELNEISNIFEVYGIHINFVLDQELLYNQEFTYSEFDEYYSEYRNTNYSSYILIASSSGNSSVLGAIYTSEKIIIYKDTIDSSFSSVYQQIALQYVISHEIGHAYGCVHSDVYSDIMYPYLSQAKLIKYPDPEFTDPNSLSELQD